MIGIPSWINDYKCDAWNICWKDISKFCHLLNPNVAFIQSCFAQAKNQGSSNGNVDGKPRFRYEYRIIYIDISYHDISRRIRICQCLCHSVSVFEHSSLHRSLESTTTYLDGLESQS